MFASDIPKDLFYLQIGREIGRVSLPSDLSITESERMLHYFWDEINSDISITSPECKLVMIWIALQFCQTKHGKVFENMTYAFISQTFFCCTIPGSQIT